MKRMYLWMLGIIFTTALMTSCVDVVDNPVNPIIPVDPLTENYILGDQMDRTVKPGDSFYDFAVGGWVANHTEYELSWQTACMGYIGYIAQEAVLNSQDPEIQHLIANLHKQGDAQKEIQMMKDLFASTLFDQNGELDLLAGWGRLSAKGYPTPVTREVSVGDNKFYAVVTVGMSELEKNTRKQGYEQYLPNSIRKFLKPFVDDESKLEEYVPKVFAFGDKVFAALNPQLSGDLKQRLQGKKLPQHSIVEAMMGRRAGALDINAATLTETFHLDSERDKIDDKVLSFIDELAKEDPEVLYLYTIYTVMMENYNFMTGFSNTDLSDDSQFEQTYDNVVSATATLINRALASALDEVSNSEECMEELEDMRKKMAERIQGLEWMSEPTKQAALYKLQKMQFYTGVPEKIIGLDAFHLTGESLLEDIMQAREQKTALQETYLGQQSYGKIGDFVQLYFPLSLHNAFYAFDFNSLYIMPAFCSKTMYPQSDEIADILQSYTISYVFGHELCHGFDAKGAQYDAEGCKKNWWAEEDLKKFKEKQQQMIDRFNELEAYPGQPANGVYTLGENMADMGGLRLAFSLFTDKVVKMGYKDEELRHILREFFLHYAQVWKEDERTLEGLQALYLSDNHSNARNRINGQVRLFDEWYDLFNVKDGAIFVQPNDRPRIW